MVPHLRCTMRALFGCHASVSEDLPMHRGGRPNSVFYFVFFFCRVFPFAFLPAKTHSISPPGRYNFSSEAGRQQINTAEIFPPRTPKITDEATITTGQGCEQSGTIEEGKLPFIGSKTRPSYPLGARAFNKAPPPFSPSSPTQDNAVSGKADQHRKPRKQKHKQNTIAACCDVICCA